MLFIIIIWPFSYWSNILFFFHSSSHIFRESLLSSVATSVKYLFPSTYIFKSMLYLIFLYQFLTIFIIFGLKLFILIILSKRWYPPGKQMFVKYLWNIPMNIFIYSWIYSCIPRIFGKSPLWNSGEYSQIIFQEYWIWEYSPIVQWISYECYMYFLKSIKKHNSRQGCSWYSLIVFKNLIFSWKSSNYVTIANCNS